MYIMDVRANYNNISKEVDVYILYGCENDPAKLYQKKISFNPDDLEKVNEILSIIVKHTYMSDSSMSIMMDDLRDGEDFEKFKEWYKDVNSSTN